MSLGPDDMNRPANHLAETVIFYNVITTISNKPLVATRIFLLFWSLLKPLGEATGRLFDMAVRYRTTMSPLDSSAITLWLGHESVQTTQIYIQATLAMMEKALASTNLVAGSPKRFLPRDDLLRFLNSS